MSTEVTNLEMRDGETIVTAQVAGSFDGSPIELRFYFTLEDEKIRALAIRG